MVGVVAACVELDEDEAPQAASESAASRGATEQVNLFFTRMSRQMTPRGRIASQDRGDAGYAAAGCATATRAASSSMSPPCAASTRSNVAP